MSPLCLIIELLNRDTFELIYLSDTLPNQGVVVTCVTIEAVFLRSWAATNNTCWAIMQMWCITYNYNDLLPAINYARVSIKAHVNNQVLIPSEGQTIRFKQHKNFWFIFLRIWTSIQHHDIFDIQNAKSIPNPTIYSF